MEEGVRRDLLAVEMSGAKDKGAGPVGETARALTAGGGFEHTRVGTGGAEVAGFGVVAVWDAGDAAEDGAECAA